MLNRHHINYFASINRIAFGVGDGAVRIWNLSKSTSLEVTSLQQQNRAKVMAVSIFYICQFMHMYYIGRMTDCVQQLIATWLLLQSPTFMKLKCYWCVHKSPPLDAIWSQINPVHSQHPVSVNYFICILISVQRFLKIYFALTLCD